MRGAEHLAAASRSGFATATVMGLVAVVALLCAGALHDALFGEQLATSRLLHQRAAGLAELGIHEAMDRLAGLDAPGSLGFALQPFPPSNDNVSVALRHTGAAAVPQGFSAGRFDLHQFEIESTGHTARGIRMTQVQGVSRVLPAAAAVVPEGTP